LGRLQKAVIGHDDSGFGSAWQLKAVEVVDVADGRRFTFPADVWIKKDNTTGKAESILLERVIFKKILIFNQHKNEVFSFNQHKN